MTVESGTFEVNDEVDELCWLGASEAADRLTSVHTSHGTFDLDLSLTAIEASFGRALTRVHRNWLVNAAYITAPYQVKAIGPADMFDRLTRSPGFVDFIRSRSEMYLLVLAEQFTVLMMAR